MLRENELEYNEQDTENIFLANAAYNTTIQDLLVSSLTFALCNTYGIRNVAIALEGHGRDQAPSQFNVSRTLGWFTTINTVLLTNDFALDHERSIIQNKECIRQTLDNSIRFNVALYGMNSKWNEISAVLFNYLGVWSTTSNTSGFEVLPMKNTVSKSNISEFPLTINAAVMDTVLRIQFMSDPAFIDESQMTQLLSSFRKRLHEQVNHCLSVKSEKRTPSDFSYKKLSVDDLDAIFD